MNSPRGQVDRSYITIEIKSTIILDMIIILVLVLLNVNQVGCEENIKFFRCVLE